MSLLPSPHLALCCFAFDYVPPTQHHAPDHRFAQAKNQLQQKSTRELELEARIEQEKHTRDAALADKEAQVYALQKTVADKAHLIKEKDLQVPTVA